MERRAVTWILRRPRVSCSSWLQPLAVEELTRCLEQLYYTWSTSSVNSRLAHITRILERQASMRVTREYDVTAAHTHSQFQRRHRRVANLLDRNTKSGRGRSGVMDRGSVVM
ncbi:hypothetical protein EVAR_34794_1 [Eumeta japonica]|uniref:Uncharacterized protein n=1 Tax=Eumeta variegata TaxID=151549 RepID=A0A4C1WB65_EUMVA|nr:hypothetical protein EVAR_34794_1 [Eumeta japonica]